MVQTITIKLQIILAIAALLIIFSCNTHQEQRVVSFSPKVVAAHGYVIPQDSLPKPKVVQAGIPKVVRAGKPKVVRTNANVHPAGIPRVVVAGVPNVCTPGQDGFSLPKIVPAIDSPFVPGIPEVEIAKEADTKEQNSQNFSFFSKQEGLKSTRVSSILEDKSGNLWFGTWVGASKYDGKSFTHFAQKEGLVSNALSCMLEDNSGNLWFGKVNTGVTKYDGKSFTNFTRKEGLSNNRVLSIGEDKNGNIWVGTENGGVNKFNGKSFTWFTEKEGLSNNFVYSILKDKSGNLWFGTDSGISKYDCKSFTNFTVNEGLSSNKVRSIVEDRSGNLWIGTLVGGVNKFDGKSFTRFGEKEGLSNDVVSITEDKRGNLWFGTAGGGVSKYDSKNFTAFTGKEGLSDNDVLSILEDKSGNLWFGTLSGGVNKYSGKNFTHFTVKEGLSNNNVRSILEDKSGNLWVGTDGGMNKYDGKSFTHFTKKEGLGTNAVLSSLEDSKGCLWIGTLGAGVDKYDGKRFTHFTEQEGLIDNHVASILEDKNGDLWFATVRGVSNYNGKTFTNFAWIKGLSNHIYYRAAEDKKGNLWFGSPTGGGAVRYDGKSFTRFTQREGLSNNFVRSIFDDKSGNLWFATLDGINEYDGESFTYYTEKEGLSNNDVWSIDADKNGDLWFGTADGLNRLKKENRTLIKTRANDTASSLLTSGLLFEIFTYEDGFLGIGVNTGKTICEAKDGTIWIGASDRLTAFHPNEENPDTTAPNIQLTGVTLFNEKIPWQNLIRPYAKDRRGPGVGDTSIILSNGVSVHDLHFDDVSKWYDLPEHLSLPYNNNYLTFQFVGITMRSPKKVKYQYKLEGFDENWSAVTSRTESPYGNLPHGKYTFKVKAMNGHGYWSREFNYSFIVRPPWWLTLWAYLTYILIFFAALWSFINWRIRKLRNEKVMLEDKVTIRTHELQKEKEKVEDTLAQVKTLQVQLIEKEKMNERLRISRELHDDVGSTLSGIVLYSHLAEDQVQAQQPAKVKSSLNKIQQSANEMVSRLNDIVWAVNPDHNSLKDLMQKLEEYAKEMAMVRNIKVQTNIPESIAELKLPVEVLHNIYLLFKEAINNSVKYSNASSLELAVQHLKHLMEFTIRDNGKGFNMATIKKGNGIMNMQKRAEEIDAEFSIKSSIFEGTTVSLKIKIT